MNHRILRASLGAALLAVGGGSLAFADAPACPSITLTAGPTPLPIPVPGGTMLLPAGASVTLSTCAAATPTPVNPVGATPSEAENALKTTPGAAGAVPPPAGAPHASLTTNTNIKTVTTTDTATNKVNTQTTKTQTTNSDTTLNGFSASDLYAGVGVSISQNLGGHRADALKFVPTSDGHVLAQVQTSQDANINVLIETHYLLHQQGLFNRPGFWKDYNSIGKLAACGPFSLVNDAGDDHDRGCGPLFVASLDSNGKISQFGAGWALGLGTPDPTTQHYPFGVGIGLLFDTSDQVVDGNVIDTNTMLVRSQYQSAVTSGVISGLVKRPTTSLFLMVSKTF